MTSRDALDKIKHIDIDGRYPYPNFLKDDVKYKESIEVIEKRLNELEARDTPMKVNYYKVNYYAGRVFKEYKCKCGQHFNSFYHLVELNFCPKCGQRLDWEEE